MKIEENTLVIWGLGMLTDTYALKYGDWRAMNLPDDRHIEDYYLEYTGILGY